jgi:hypothetical protein
MDGTGYLNSASLIAYNKVISKGCKAAARSSCVADYATAGASIGMRASGRGGHTAR